MNQRAQALGMKNSCFVTPSGLDAEGHQSTAEDLALLMRAALRNVDFCEIASAKTARLEYGNPPYARSLTNHNKLLWNCEGVIGGKTGFTKKAGRCLVSAAERSGMTLICVTLGCPDDWNVHAQLYDRCFALLEPVALIPTEKTLWVPVAGQNRKIALLPQQQPVLPLTPQEKKLVKSVLLVPAFLYAPVQAGQRVGRVLCFVDETLVFATNLVAAEGVEGMTAGRKTAKGFWHRLSNITGGII